MKGDQNKLEFIDRSGQKHLVIPSSCNLETVLHYPHTPGILKDIIKKVCWQFRVELTIGKLVMSPNLEPAFVAVLLAWEVEVAYPEEDKTSSLPSRIMDSLLMTVVVFFCLWQRIKISMSVTEPDSRICLFHSVYCLGFTQIFNSTVLRP